MYLILISGRRRLINKDNVEKTLNEKNTNQGKVSVPKIGFWLLWSFIRVRGVSTAYTAYVIPGRVGLVGPLLLAGSSLSSAKWVWWVSHLYQDIAKVGARQRHG